MNGDQALGSRRWGSARPPTRRAAFFPAVYSDALASPFPCVAGALAWTVDLAPGTPESRRPERRRRLCRLVACQHRSVRASGPSRWALGPSSSHPVSLRGRRLRKPAPRPGHQRRVEYSPHQNAIHLVHFRVRPLFIQCHTPSRRWFKGFTCIRRR